MKALKNIEKSRLLLVDGQKLLVLEKLTNKKRYTLPGGIKKKHESHLAGLIRETYEEIGILLDKSAFRYIATERVKKKNLIKRKHYFVANATLGVPKLMEPQKFKAILWLPWYEVVKFMDASDRAAVTFYFEEQKRIAT
ncbi:NUDIX hydrolase [Sungkyunkwania multivorans]|uniref:NUDIX hydrolase n=1 Tax=Sungkyunkwania multivorans TaxID=1173618 RepID=A0ABW3CXY0_9FLAO